MFRKELSVSALCSFYFWLGWTDRAEESGYPEAPGENCLVCRPSKRCSLPLVTIPRLPSRSCVPCPSPTTITFFGLRETSNIVGCWPVSMHVPGRAPHQEPRPPPR